MTEQAGWRRTTKKAQGSQEHAEWPAGRWVLDCTQLYPIVHLGIFGLFGYFVIGGSPTFLLAWGGGQLPLPVLQWSERTDITYIQTKQNKKGVGWAAGGCYC